MPLPSPDLDDRTFDQLVAAARERITQTAPEWSDLSAGDPGMALVDVFAYLADTMIYRLNRVPDKLYVEFLRLIGVRIGAPTAASVVLRIERERNAPDVTVEVPRGTRVTVGTPASGSEAAIFSTVALATLPVGTGSIDVPALHAEPVDGELLGRASGRAGDAWQIARPPVVASTGDPLDLMIGVEARADELAEGDPAIEWDGRTYRIWREVTDFSDPGPDRHVYIADRTAGSIAFAPAARVTEEDGGLSPLLRPLAAVPPANRQVLAWYRRGGGPLGNVAAGTLTLWRDPMPGLIVANPAPATGGRAEESLENALVRGPQELHSLSRAVTARDYQLVAERSSGAVARARAFTQAALWRYATPGTVEVVIVPALPDPAAAAAVSADQLRSLETEDARALVQRVIDERRPLGTACVVNWARYKTVRVRATIVVGREEDPAAVRRRVDERLRLTVNPLPTSSSVGGWPFGQPLFASNVYKIVLSEPGVRYARGIRLIVDSVPGRDVAALAADAYQPATWYAGSAQTIFRTLNDGEGWEPMGSFEAERVSVVRVHQDRPGLLAVATTLDDGSGSRVYVSRDSGETWDFTRRFGFLVEDVAWQLRDGAPNLVLATSAGLYQLGIEPDADPVQLLVEPSDQDLAFYAVVATQEVRGEVTVVAAAQGTGGVYLSSDGGRTGTFRAIGLRGEDVRVLAVQYDGPRSFVWAGTAAPGGDQPGKGAFRRELLGREDPPQGWVAHGKGWTAGSCWALAFQGTTVVAATQQVGVLRLDVSRADPSWVAPSVGSGLPLRDPGRFHPVLAVATDPDGERVMAGGPVGVYRTVVVGGAGGPAADGEALYEDCSRSEFPEEVTLPPTWLFTCGESEIEVLGDASS